MQLKLKPLSRLAAMIGTIGLTLGAGSVQAQQNISAGTTTFATGTFVLPEGITAAPTGYGSGYLVSDANAVDVNGTIYRIPADGGAATVFSATDFRVFGTTQLSNYYGAQSGQLLAVGTSTTQQSGVAELISQSGGGTSLLNQANSWFTSVTTATTNFGSIQAGQVVLTDETQGAIQVLGANGQLNTFATVTNVALGQSIFGAAFAPSTFGSHAGDLFVSANLDLAGSVGSGDLYVVDAQGNSSLFATVALPAGAQSPGLRQIAFAPAGFGQYGGDLFLSIAAQSGGGGNLGEIEVFNSSGQEVALFNQGSAANPLDPRGLLFTTIDGQSVLLAANADPDIDLVTSQSFTPAAAPEIDPTSAASAITLLLGSLFVLTAGRREGSVRHPRAKIAS